MLLRAKTVVPINAPPLDNGAVAVNEEGQITAVGPYPELARAHSGGQVVDLGESVLLPGLINAHCHLDYSGLRDAINPQKTFTRWVARINALKRQMTDDDYIAAIAAGFRELQRWGTTTVCNLEAFPELLPRLPAPPIRTWWFVELIDIRSRETTEELLARAVSFFQRHRGWLGGFGLNPHAPYTASPALYQLCADCAARHGLPLTTHIAESADEEAMFRRAEGEMYEFFRSLGRPMDDCGKKSAFSIAVERGMIGPGWLLAHANELEDEDFELIRATPGAWHVVHCPGSHAFFSHRPFPWRRLEEAGAFISLGTDSLASNGTLSLFDEMRTARQTNPDLDSETLLKTITLTPAKALGQAGHLGELAPGAQADIIALPFDGKPSEVYDAIVANQTPIPWIMINGEVL
jgi:aminodeoxyfutalosine deaminase